MNDLRRLFKIITTDIVIFLVPFATFVLLFPKLIKIFLPVIVALLLFLCANPLNKILKKRVGASLAAFISLFAILFIGGGAVWLVISKLFSEIKSLALDFPSFSSNSSETVRYIAGRLSAFGARTKDFMPESSAASNFFEALVESLKGQLQVFLSKSASIIIDFAKNVPTVFITAFAAILSSYFFLKDTHIIASFFRNFFGDKLYEKTKFSFLRVTGMLRCYLKAQLMVESIIFAVLLAGFFILRVKYAFLMSLITAVVDAIPVLGTGTILLPWAIVSIILGDGVVGWGLVSLYGVCLVTRQIIEPKIVGANLGIHPVVSIISIYLGMRFLGFLGLVLGPIIALLLKSLINGNIKTEQ